MLRLFFNAGTPTNLSTLGVGSKEIHHLDASHQDFLFHRHLNEVRSLSMDGREVLRGDGATLINRLACLAVRFL